MRLLGKTVAVGGATWEGAGNKQ